MKNLINNQHINVEGRTLTIAIQWCVKGLQVSDSEVHVDILQALEALLRKKTSTVQMVYCISIIFELNLNIVTKPNLVYFYIHNC